MQKPILRHVVNFWTMSDYPTAKKSWKLERQLQEMKATGFDTVTAFGSPELYAALQKYGLGFIGYMASSKASEFEPMLRRQKECGARYVNAHIGRHDTPTAEAVKMVVKLHKLARKMNMDASIETHRNTCTETPEKIDALAEGFFKETGELINYTYDFSHLAVVKHLDAPYAGRLLTDKKLIQHAHQMHLRPFNGHHAQVPVTDGKGKLTPEVKEYLKFAEELFFIWQQGPQNKGRELFVCPEMGPINEGYNLSVLPHSWPESVRLRSELEKVWNAALKRKK